MATIPAEIAEFISYDPLTGEFEWKRVRTGVAVAGAKAGGLFASREGGGSYWRIRFLRKSYFGHRLAWFLTYGEDRRDIDHKDRDGLNNRLDNLRIATRSQQAANRKGFGRSAKGVYRTPWGTYTAQVRANGKRIHLGTFPTEQAASAAYAAKAKEVFGEFYCAA